MHVRPRAGHNRAHRFVSGLLASLFTVSVFAFPQNVEAAPQNHNSAGEIALSLRKLLVVGNVLYVGAHPDDENTAMLSWLSQGRHYRAAYLSLTRGDGGQNLIGSERGEQVGLIRTHELLEARRIDGAEQFFTRAIDFGYSKSPEETLAIWGHDEVLSDVVRVIRTFRPDVIVNRFPTNGDGGHGQHTASATLAEEAVVAAADPNRFPEQIRRDGLSPWKVRRLFWNAWRIKPEERDPALPKLLTIDLGAYNPLLGRSYSEIAGESRTMHKSQGFGSPERRGTLLNYLEPRLGEKAESDLMEGIDTTWKRLPGGAAVIAPLERAVATFRPDHPEEVLGPLVTALRAMRTLPPSPWVEEKQRETIDVIRSASGLWMEAIAARYSATPGSELPVAALVLNRSGARLILKSIEWPWGSQPMQTPVPLENNKPFKSEVTLRVPPTQPETNPYWLNLPPGKGLFSVSDPRTIGLPVFPPQVSARLTLDVEGELVTYDVPVQYRATDPVRGERYRPLEIVPKVSLHIPSTVLYFAAATPKEVGVVVRAGKASVEGKVALQLPAGWRTEGAQPFALSTEGSETTLRFLVTPPAAESLGVLRAEATVDGETFSHDAIRIDYSHLPPLFLSPPAQARLVRKETAIRGKRVGYIEGSGDDVPIALRQLGFEVAFLSDEDLQRSDLSSYDAIVAGVRAYNTRKGLVLAQPRLLDFVKNGGTYVVQYNTNQDLVVPEIGPYPLKPSRDRVTVEASPVQILNPDHPLLLGPNRIGSADFEGWVQERGLYFPTTWDERYVPLLGMNDPGEKESRGSLLVARWGKGTFIATGIAFFRQLPEGVPGAWRLFANLVSAGKK